MKSDVREALADYVRACGGNPQTDVTETMERRVARKRFTDLFADEIEDRGDQRSDSCPNCPCSNCNAL